MERSVLGELNIILGYNCNFNCSHCGNNSYPGNKGSDLSEVEIEILLSEIKKMRPESILFSGGETTLYIDRINKLLSKLPCDYLPKVKIVTNGWFGYSDEKIKSLLEGIRYLAFVDMSFDFFHKTLTKIDYVKKIESYCRSKDISFEVKMSISSLLELIEAKKILKDIVSKISFQKTLPSGRAKDNNLEFTYYVFDESVLNKKCPSDGRIAYIPQKGFSTCCSSLAFNQSENFLYNSTIKDHKKSKFYDLMSTKSFLEISKILDIKIPRNDYSLSSECSLCEYLFTRKCHNENI